MHAHPHLGDHAEVGQHELGQHRLDEEEQGSPEEGRRGVEDDRHSQEQRLEALIVGKDVA